MLRLSRPPLHFGNMCPMSSIRVSTHPVILSAPALSYLTWLPIWSLVIANRIGYSIRNVCEHRMLDEAEFGMSIRFVYSECLFYSLTIIIEIVYTLSDTSMESCFFFVKN